MPRTSPPPTAPLVLILGSTGTGKSKLAVELATRFDGEIVNADAMQMYQGLPITTNKMPVDERRGIPHHLLDFIPLDDEPWTVSQFVRESTGVIDQIRSRGRLPIVVGGTHYYTHGLLFPSAILADSLDKADGTEQQGNAEEQALLSLPTDQLLSKLRQVDPAMADKWHPHDRRKIQRSLQIWLQTGKTASEVYAEQRAQRQDHVTSDFDAATRPTEDMVDSPAGLRYPTLLLWLEATDAVLKQRLDDRVDSMVRSGLGDEATTMANLHSELRRRGIPVDMTKGIWASIGYKELLPWVEVPPAQGSDCSAPSPPVPPCAIEAVKAATRQYAKRQNRYIRIRLATALEAADQLHMLYALDCSDLDRWDAAVGEPARELVGSFLAARPLPDPQSLSDLAAQLLSAAASRGPDLERRARHCDRCDKTLMSDKEWKAHLASRRHKNTVAAHQRRQRGADAAESAERAQTTIREGP